MDTMDNWSYINYDDLIKSIINGSHSIQQQFSINNIDNTNSKNISFLNYLLSYDNINKENILEIIYNLYNTLHNNIINLNQNNCIKNMVKRIKDEWFLDENINIIPNNIINLNYLKNNTKSIKEYKEACKECDEIYSLCKNERDIPFESKLSGSLPMIRYVQSIDIILDKSLKKINQQMEDTNKMIQFFNESYVSLLLDLSMKHKSMYNLFDNNNEIKNVPDNIHIIYSNYLFMHNLLHKQTIQNIKYLNDILTDINERITKIKGLKVNIETLAEISKKIPDEIEEQEIEKEIKQNIYNDNTIDNINELSGGKVSHKLISFF